MAKLALHAGQTSKTLRLFIQDATSATGAGLTGLTPSSGITAAYAREGTAPATAMTLVSATAGTWTSSGFVALDATNMPGVYELGIPNAALAAGAKSVTVYLAGATNMVPIVLEIELDVPVNLDFTQAVPTSNTTQTVGDTLNAARAQGFGPWTISGTTLTLYAADGVTAVRTFTLNSATTPTSRV